jgi:MFS family permease
MCLGFIQNFGSFVTVRALLGAAEGGLLPGMVLYLSTMYTRGEMALRIGLFYTTASLSGAFGGLLARGFSEIGHRGGLSPWRWIFVIEGLLVRTLLLVTYFLYTLTEDSTDRHCWYCRLLPLAQWFGDSQISHS